jgi:hypothetical protein
MWKAFATAAVTGLALAASPASATDFNLGTLNTAYTHSETVSPGTINDNYFFSLAEGNLGAGLASVTVSLPGMGSVFNIAGLTGSLFTATNALVGSFSDTGTYTNLAAGSYRFNVSGTANGALGGVYALALAPEAAVPVPGPAGLLVALGGAATVGWRKRKKRIADAQAATA